MDLTFPQISNDELNSFTLGVGRAIQNYGVIESLINKLIEVIIKDSLIQHHIIKQAASKRIEILEGFVKRDGGSIDGNGIKLTTLFNDTRDALKNRNKLAHNPFVIEEKRAGVASSNVWGINVIRYSQGKNSEEWIDVSELNIIISESCDLIARFNQLLEHYDPITE